MRILNFFLIFFFISALKSYSLPECDMEKYPRWFHDCYTDLKTEGGLVYKGEWWNGYPSKGFFKGTDGQIREGEFKKFKGKPGEKVDVEKFFILHGKGSLTSTYGLKTTGSFKNGKAHGDIVITYPDGTLLQKCNFKNGKCYGPCELYIVDIDEAGKADALTRGSNSYKGNCNDSRKHGKGIYSDSKFTYDGIWKLDKFVKGTKSFMFNGAKIRIVGEFNGVAPHGEATLYSGDDIYYIGEWKDGKYDGTGTETLPGYPKYVGEWKDGKKHGKGTTIDANGKSTSGRYEHGKKVGRHVEINY